jgi:crotonobetainyl-CoA:carnitine CoA-transferase CaiB-like acyl-CoA transferase
MAAMFAIYQRDQGGGGLGQVIDVSLYEPLFRLIEAQVIGFDQLGIVKTRQGNRLAEDSPRNTYETRDGRWVGISASSQRTFERLVEAMGRPELANDPRYADNVTRCANADELDALIATCRVARLDGARGMQQADDARRPAVHTVKEPARREAKMLREHGDIVGRKHEAGGTEPVHRIPG